MYLPGYVKLNAFFSQRTLTRYRFMRKEINKDKTNMQPYTKLTYYIRITKDIQFVTIMKFSSSVALVA